MYALDYTSITARQELGNEALTGRGSTGSRLLRAVATRSLVPEDDAYSLPSPYEPDELNDRSTPRRRQEGYGAKPSAMQVRLEAGPTGLGSRLARAGGTGRLVPTCSAYRGVRGRPCLDDHQRWIDIMTSNHALPKSQPPRMSVAQCSPTQTREMPLANTNNDETQSKTITRSRRGRSRQTR
jgi:hypothetical protein